MLAALQTIENPALHLAVHLSMSPFRLREGEIPGLQPSDLDFDAARWPWHDSGEQDHAASQ